MLNTARSMANAPLVQHLEKGIDMLQITQGTGYAEQFSAMEFFYGWDDLRMHRSDEIQVANRMRNLTKMLVTQRKNMRLAMWGSKEETDNTNGRGRGRNRR